MTRNKKSSKVSQSYKVGDLIYIANGNGFIKPGDPDEVWITVEDTYGIVVCVPRRTEGYHGGFLTVSAGGYTFEIEKNEIRHA